MMNQKLDTLQWFIERIKATPGAYLWLASSSGIITGSPITPTEYNQTIFNDPHADAQAEIQNILALKDVTIRVGNVNNKFNVALVDLDLVVAWGGFDPATSYSADNP